MYILKTASGVCIGTITSLPQMLDFVSIAKKKGHKVAPPVVEGLGLFSVTVYSFEESRS